MLNERSFLDGTAWIDILSDERPEIWANVHIRVNDVNPEMLYQEICEYAYELMVRFVHSQVDVNSLALSFHVDIARDNKSSRNLFFRTNRSEFHEISTHPQGREEFPINLKNVLFDELFRGFGGIDA